MKSLPNTMRAVAIDRFGGPKVLTIHILPVPSVGPREVLIAVHTAGVGSWDADMRTGWWPQGKPRFPLVLGTDGAGRIAAVGSGVRRFRPKDRVYIQGAARRFAPGGVDAVLAFAGGPALSRCLDALRPGGRFAYPNGIEPVPRKRRGIRTRSYDGVPGIREFERLTRAIERARLKVPIAAAYRLADAARAHRRVTKGHVLGKIVLRVR